MHHIPNPAIKILNEFLTWRKITEVTGKTLKGEKELLSFGKHILVISLKYIVSVLGQNSHYH